MELMGSPVMSRLAQVVDLAEAQETSFMANRVAYSIDEGVCITDFNARVAAELGHRTSGELGGAAKDVKIFRVAP
jgi:hypothetical protein